MLGSLLLFTEFQAPKTSFPTNELCWGNWVAKGTWCEEGWWYLLWVWGSKSFWGSWETKSFSCTLKVYKSLGEQCLDRDTLVFTVPVWICCVLLGMMKSEILILFIMSFAVNLREAWILSGLFCLIALVLGNVNLEGELGFHVIFAP